MFFLASALTFDFLLASLPLALLLLAALGYFVQSGQEALDWVLMVLDQALPPAAAGHPSPLQPVERFILTVVESRTTLSIYGIPLFLLFATRFFSSARTALNEVFDTEETRHLMHRKGIDLLLVVATLVLLVANTGFTVVMATQPWFGRFVSVLSAYVFGVILFFVVYTLAPSRPMRGDTAILAAAVASLGFEVAKQLFALYLANFATVDRLISNANGIAAMLFVVWIYATACIFLLGGEVADTYDLMQRQREQRAILA